MLIALFLYTSYYQNVCYMYMYIKYMTVFCLNTTFCKGIMMIDVKKQQHTNRHFVWVILLFKYNIFLKVLNQNNADVQTRSNFKSKSRVLHVYKHDLYFLCCDIRYQASRSSFNSTTSSFSAKIT